MRHIVILGAGISGLSTAWFLKKRFGKEIVITLIDQQERVGGWIQTVQKEGFLFEQGPRSCRAAGAGLATLQLIEDLGLQDQVITADASAKVRYLYQNGSLHPLPTGPLSFLLSPLMKGVIPALIRDWRTPRGEKEDESIYDFFRRRFGPTIAERFADPLTSGIYAGDIRQLSVRSCFPFLYRWEQEHGSILRGAFKKKAPQTPVSSFIQSVRKEGLFSFKGGMEMLTKEIAHQLDAEILLGTTVTSCSWEQEGIQLRLSNGSTLEADHLFAAIPPTALLPLIPKTNEGLIQECRGISYGSVAVVSIGFKENVLNKKGFGYLIPSAENQEILGVVWDSCVFPQQNQLPDETRLTVMLGGAHHPNIQNLSETECLDIALHSLDRHLHIRTVPSVTAIKFACEAIPQYPVGHHLWADRLNQSLADLSPHITLVSTATGGAAVNDCISKSCIT
jgi:protoporphyrinogen/coproporphyrinogen III oxidase